MSYIEFRDVSKIYTMGQTQIRALDHISFAVEKGELCVIVGPSGALDYNTGKAVLKLLQDTCREQGKTVLIITHNGALTQIADRVIRVKNGAVVDMTVNDAPMSVERIEW